MKGKKSINVHVEPSVLSWAVQSSGWAIDDLTKKLKISRKIFDRWLVGTGNPTLNQLEELSNLLKRPLSAFFLSVPPTDKPLPKDYRLIPGREGKFDRKTILAIRRARSLQTVSLELSTNLNASVQSSIQKASLSENPIIIAEKLRGELGFSEEKQKKLNNPYLVFNFLRESIEDRNILVFQISMPVDDARGFALVDVPPSIIVVNSKDTIEARIFTLMHEFGHVLLQESGIDLPETVLGEKNIEAVENWCNDFSSAFLLPETIAKKIFSANAPTLTDSETLKNLSRSLKLSKAMLLYNMAKFKYISWKHYRDVLSRYAPSKNREKSKAGKIFAPSADKKCFSEKGQRFVSLVLNNVDRGFITHSDALGYLSIKAKNLDKVTRKAKK